MCPHDAYLDAEDCTRCMDPQRLAVGPDGMLTLAQKGKPCVPVTCEGEDIDLPPSLLGVPPGEGGVRLPED